MRRLCRKIGQIIPHLRFFVLFCFLMAIILRAPSPLILGSVQRGSPNWGDFGRVFPEELRVNSFPWWVPTSLGQVCSLCASSYTPPPVILAEWSGSDYVPLRWHGVGTDAGHLRENTITAKANYSQTDSSYVFRQDQPKKFKEEKDTAMLDSVNKNKQVIRIQSQVNGVTSGRAKNRNESRKIKRFLPWKWWKKTTDDKNRSWSWWGGGGVRVMVVM